MKGLRISLPDISWGGKVLIYNHLHKRIRGLAAGVAYLAYALLVPVEASAGSLSAIMVSEQSPLNIVALLSDSQSAAGRLANMGGTMGTLQPVAQSALERIGDVDMPTLSPDSQSAAARVDTASFSVYYELGRTLIERRFRDNDSLLDAAARNLRRIVHDRGLRIFKVYIFGAASPEGPADLNARLAVGRAESVKAFLKHIEPRLGEEDFVLVSRGEDWEGAEKIAESYDSVDGNNEVSSIFKGVMSPEEKKRIMKNLNGGLAWSELISSYYPELRRSDIHVVYGAVSPIAQVACAGTGLEAPYANRLAPMTVFPEEEPVANPEPKFRSFAVKTNLLYDAATALNVAVEVPVGKRFSVQYEHIFPWWTAGPSGNKYSMQVLSFGGEGRWWFAPRVRDRKGQPGVGADARRDLLLGHYLGLYAHGGKFDMQAGRDFGCYQNYFKGIGLSYGYSLPLGRRISMEFAISLGYMMLDYQHYVPSDDWSILIKDASKAGRKNYFGPTKAKVSLVVPIVFKAGGKS